MKLIMVSAGFENMGNTLHRFLDSHPNLLVYPFESMWGGVKSSNILTPAIPFRYAYPTFDSEDTEFTAYDKFYDEEMKTYLRTKNRSKFKDCGMIIDEKDRIEAFNEYFNERYMDLDAYSRKNYIEAYFESTFEAWKNLNKTGNETHYVGYIPGVLMDTDKIITDFPDAKIIHIIRNPWSAYADYIKRPFCQSLECYCQIWNHIQLTAFTYQSKYPNNFDIVFAENLCAYPELTMTKVAKFLEIPMSDNILYPSFNGQKLETIFPWGTVKYANIEANQKTAQELPLTQRIRIARECNVVNSIIYNQDMNYFHQDINFIL